jgi:hypothetical protein
MIAERPMFPKTARLFVNKWQLLWCFSGDFDKLCHRVRSLGLRLPSAAKEWKRTRNAGASWNVSNYNKCTIKKKWCGNFLEKVLSLDNRAKRIPGAISGIESACDGRPRDVGVMEKSPLPSDSETELKVVP